MRKTSSRTFASLALALAVASGTLASSPAAYGQQRSAADIAQARELYNEGTSLRDKGDLAGALEKLRAAHSLAATPITGLELGRTYVAAGKLVEAREVFLGVGRLPVASQETARSTAARASAAQLADQVRGRIPKLTVRITGAPADAVSVTIDGSAVPSDGLGAPRLVNPGKHDVVAAPSNGTHATASVDLKEGEAREIELHVTPAAGPSVAGGPGADGAAGSGGGAATPGGGLAGGDSALPASDNTASAPASPAKRVLIYGGFGLAAVGVAAGSVTGLIAMGKASSINDACRNTSNCPRSIDSDLQTGRTMGTVSTIAFAAAGAGAVAGVIGLLIGPKKETAPAATAAWITPWVGAGGAGITGVGQF